ncbi:MAG: hypothetical protein ACOH5I_15100 [Oligoflexus sp.]
MNRVNVIYIEDLHEGDTSLLVGEMLNEEYVQLDNISFGLEIGSDQSL